MQKREIRKGKAFKKPKFRYKVDTTGAPVFPTKISGYNPDEVEGFNKWFKRTIENTKKQLATGMGDRFKKEINKQLRDYFNTKWGISHSFVKQKAKVKKTRKKVKRINKLLWKNLENWNRLEDFRENKIIRDRLRIQKELKNEQFSFKKFLAEDREKKRKPYIIEDEETFRKRIKEDMQNYLFQPPKAVRRKYRMHNYIGYPKRLEREVGAPMLMEIRRRARVAELVQQREDAIAFVKYKEKVLENRKKRMEEKQKEFLQKNEYWNEVIGQWRKENNALLVMRRDYQFERERVMSEARKEFLTALNDTVDLWAKSPNECRFLRFRFDEHGEQFPYTKAEYI